MAIEIRSPCNASWEDMQALGPGRHCDACGKVVTDFSAMSEREVLSYLENTRGRVCGRLRQDQLAPPTWHVSHVLRTVAFALAFLPAYIRGQAQRHEHSTPVLSATIRIMGDTTIVPGRISAPPPASPLSDSLIYLRLVDSKNNPVRFGQVTIKQGTNKEDNKSYVADADGMVIIPFPAKAKRIRLLVAAVGYVEDSFSVRRPTKGPYLRPVKVIRLRLRETFLGEVVVTTDGDE